MKLQTKLTLFNALSKIVIVVLFVLLLPVLTTRINLGFIDNRLRKQKDKVMQEIRTYGIKSFMPAGESYGSYTLLKEEYISLDEEPQTFRRDTIGNDKRVVDHRDTIEYRILSHSFRAGDKAYLLEIGKSVDSIGETNSPLQNIALQVLLGMVLMTILADFSYVRYVLQPLEKIIRAKLSGRKFPVLTSYERIKTSTYDFKYLDDSIHLMIGHIEAAFQKEREFISNASHELMTPVSILQSKIENLFDREDITDEVQMQLLAMQKTLNRLKNIAQTLLLISQIENEQFIREDSVSVPELVQDVHEEIAIRLEDKNISFSSNFNETQLLVNVNRFLLFNLLFNLVNNSIKYNVPNGAIRINGFKTDGKYLLEVSDTGKGIPADQIPFIFDRFKKFRQSSPQDSFGLGLPIVKSIADFHGIEIEVETVPEKGSTFRLIFAEKLLG